MSDNIYFGVATFTPYSFLRSSTNPVVVIPMVAWQPPMQTLSGWSRPAVIYWWRRMIAWRDKPPWFLTYHFPSLPHRDMYLLLVKGSHWKIFNPGLGNSTLSRRNHGKVKSFFGSLQGERWWHFLTQKLVTNLW